MPCGNRPQLRGSLSSRRFWKVRNWQLVRKQTVPSLDCAMIRLFLTTLLCLTAVSAGAAEVPAASERTWKIDGVERTALLYIPAAASTRKSPVIFAFHGHGGTMRYAARKFGY